MTEVKVGVWLLESMRGRRKLDPQVTQSQLQPTSVLGFPVT